MDNYCVCFRLAGDIMPDVMMAHLSDFPFYSFEESEDELKAYIHAKDWPKETQQGIKSLSEALGISYREEFLPYQNWNAIWEANFQPIEVPGFCGVRASFHPSFENVKHEILIDPEMAFGTGHHATTFMVMDLMQAIPFRGKKVFDYGCGTGILAILAAKLEAAHIDAVDIEKPAYENTLKNAEKNSVFIINVIHGTLEQVTQQDFDIILANINRNVILDSLDTLFEKAASGASLVLSGILHNDLPEVKQAAESSGFQYERHLEKDGWIALLMKKA